jgi:glycerol-3-phosphate dehydrogenase
VVNAAGPWAERVQGLAGEPQVRLAAAKGVHLVVAGDRIASRTGLIARTADSVLVVRPWNGLWIIGTTDTPWRHDPGEPVATAADVDYLLGELNRWLAEPLGREDVISVYAGVRPLVRPARRDGATTAALSRDHAVLAGPEGLFTVVGGKYTTYRRMAEDAIDAVVAHLGGPAGPSVTASTPLLGADGWAAQRARRSRLAAGSGLSLEGVDHLLGRYGALALELLELLRARPELGRPIPGAPTYLRVEAVYAASHEGALHLDDVLARRLRVAMETRDGGAAAAAAVAGLAGDVLGWDPRRRAAEVAGYERAVEADRRAAREPTDDAAVAARERLRDDPGGAGPAAAGGAAAN